MSGFPFGTAASNKLFLMGKALIQAGWDFTVISNIYVRPNSLNKTLTKSGIIDNINYFTTSPSVFRPNKKQVRAIAKIIGKIKEFAFVNKKIITGDINVVFIYSFRFVYTFLYTLYLRLFGCKVYLIYFEFRQSLSHRYKFHQIINDKLFDNVTIKWVNGVILISDSLVAHVKKRSPEKPIIKIPPLVNFDAFKVEKSDKQNEPYFLYCGTTQYKDVIDFIIRCFTSMKNNEHVKIILVVSGDEQSKEKLKQEYEKLISKEKLSIIGNLDYSELVSYYINALALLIPLRNTLQDISRFPQKVAEYCASANPIVTTAFGEMPIFFEDGISALMASDFDEKQFTKKLDFVIDNPDRAQKIGQAGYNIGLSHFDYRSYAESLGNFIKGNND